MYLKCTLPFRESQYLSLVFETTTLPHRWADSNIKKNELKWGIQGKKESYEFKMGADILFFKKKSLDTLKVRIPG